MSETIRISRPSRVGDTQPAATGHADYFSTRGWNLVDTLELPPREAELLGVGDLALSPESRGYLERVFPGGVYRHQKEAVRRHLDGHNVCMSTGTASGKSLPFYVSAMESLSRDPSSRIMAIYPLKALGREQEARWREALEEAGIPASVGRIDGQVPVSERIRILRRSQVLILTPDIIHAWLLSNLGDESVRSFVRRVSLIVVDEVHSYTGVFGSNAAFLFRRLQHAMGLLGSSARYMCASATISDPDTHLKKLLGVPFSLVGPELDTSPGHGMRILFASPPRVGDLLGEVSHYLNHLASGPASRFIAFVDSRKQAELISSIVAREQDSAESGEEEANLDEERLRRLRVLPYRAGYEERDRDLIQDRLTAGALSGVVSTSALELGIDIPYLDTAVLVGVPRSSTSLHQRIGRIGRHAPGTVVVINTGDVYNEAIFEEPERLLSRPLAQGALYLENTRIQYIHALCLARDGGEHDQVCAATGAEAETALESGVDWPEGFLQTCRQERLGEIPVDLQSMKAESGESPQHVFPLRDVESQFRVELRKGPERRPLGSLGYGQMMREAYPGAVYYYATQPFRVCRIYSHSRTIQVREEKRYTTRPQQLPTLVFPNLTGENVYRAKRYGDLIVAECALQVRECVNGFKERRGSTEFGCEYPTSFAGTGVKFDAPRFTRNYFTTGVVVSHPALDGENVEGNTLSALLYEAFFMQLPFERQDINFAVDRHRADRGPLVSGSRFLAIYDQTYGSLRLTSRLMEDETLRGALETLLDLTGNPDVPEPSSETLAAADAIRLDALEEPREISLGTSGEAPAASSETRERVILPGSKGLNAFRDNSEFAVEGIFFSPLINGLSYRGRYPGTDPSVTESVPARYVVEIPGESETGLYNYETGEIEPSSLAG